MKTVVREFDNRADARREFDHVRKVLELEHVDHDLKFVPRLQIRTSNQTIEFVSQDK